MLLSGDVPRYALRYAQRLLGMNGVMREPKKAGKDTYPAHPE